MEYELYKYTWKFIPDGEIFLLKFGKKKKT